jgi:hypothetical protein
MKFVFFEIPEILFLFLKVLEIPEISKKFMKFLKIPENPEKFLIFLKRCLACKIFLTNINPSIKTNRFSRQVLFSISQKLIQHQIANYTGKYSLALPNT